MAPSYELIYFNARGRAEPSRCMFEMAGVKYKDTRYEKKDWSKYKPGTKTNQLPLLIVDDKIIPQSGAINRYLAKTFGFFGKTIMDETKLDSIICCIEDACYTFTGITSNLLPKNIVEEKMMKYKSETLPKWLNYFEEELNNRGYFLDYEDYNLTIAEVVLISFIEFFNFILPFDGDKYPKIKKMRKNFNEHPRIAEWLNKRPVTET